LTSRFYRNPGDEEQAARSAGETEMAREKEGIPELHINGDVCVNLEESSTLEWLETNGIGGYSSSTVPGMNTRRYHGLLVAAVHPPAGRIVAVSRMDEILDTPRGKFELATSRFPGAVHPEGYRHLDSFHIDPFPRWVYRAGGVMLEKTLVMARGFNAVALRYRWLEEDGKLAVGRPREHRTTALPFIAYRDYHHLLKSDQFRSPAYREEAEAIVLSPLEGLPDLVFRCQGFRYEFAPEWYYNFEYALEQERGLDFTEDLLTPGKFIETGDDPDCYIVFAVGIDPAAASVSAATPREMFEEWSSEEIERRAALVSRIGSGADELTRRLVLSADAFIVDRGETGKSVLAGYPWFTDWGRDTMISLPGLTIATRRYHEARSILETFGRHVKAGLIPNRFPDGGEEPAYNTVDAPLWYAIAADAYLRATKDYGALKDFLWKALHEICHSYIEGTLNNIHMDDDGLIIAGDATTQLTWMDAKVGEWVVTPRHGKAVEVNALWYNTLRIMERLAGRMGVKDDIYKGLARKVSREFTSTFWNREARCLFDVVNESGPDPSIRPNQILAISLPRMLLSADRREKMLKVVERHLVTPCGLRSLSPNDPRYRGEYAGGVAERDGAYHQGTVWSWLSGHYAIAVMKVYGSRSARAHRMAMKALIGLEGHIAGEAGLNHISEIFDGDEPFRPRGCFAQAWSTAELLRVRMQIGEG